MTGETLLVADRLSVAFGRGAARREVLHDVSFSLARGRITALVGESGSGKSVAARALIGLAGEGADVRAAALRFRGQDLLALRPAAWRALRGRDIGFVLQDALVSLDPLRTVGREIAEALAAHGVGDRRTREARVLALMERVGLPEAELRARQLPSELSGGLRQRALIASALAMDPDVLIADEPTTALDATVQAQILALLRELRGQGRAILLITHDLPAAASVADEVLVLRHGRLVEAGPTTAVLQHPAHAYTRQLIDSVPGRDPHGTRTATARPGAPLLEAAGLRKSFRSAGGHDRLAVADVDFVLHEGETLGIVGESGSGKTSVARLVAGLIEPDAGTIRFRGEPWVGAGVSERARRPHRHDIAFVYQDPLGSFDPRWTVARILADALGCASAPTRAHGERIAALLATVRLPETVAAGLPRLLSGGQRQRVAIARALATRPRILVCDEPVSALDVSVQAQVLDLLADLQHELGLACLFISHDLRVVRHVSDTVMVMRDGHVVEHGGTESVFDHPQHPFTRALLAASPPIMHTAAPAPRLAAVAG